MNLDVYLSSSIKLSGPKDGKTTNYIYLPHEQKTISYDVPNSITVSNTVRLKGLGLTGQNGEKGTLYIKIDSIDYEDNIRTSERKT